MLGNNNINFGSLRLLEKSVTKNTLGKYVDSMDTMRAVSDSLGKISRQSDDILVDIKGKIVKNAQGDFFTFETFNAKDSSLLGKMAIATDNLAQRAESFRKFCDETVVNLMKFFK